jgi:hypothetical protein
MKKPSNEQIEATANAIMQLFIPKNKDEQAFSFHFTIPPAFNFKASYELDEKSKWVLMAYEEITV